MKICNVCKETKHESEFYKVNGYLSYRCKECTKKAVNEYRILHKEEISEKRKPKARLYRQKNKRTKTGWLHKIYAGMRKRNRDKFQKELSFSYEEFVEWIETNYKERFEKLFKEYIDSDCEKSKCPSIDRIDDYKGYEFDNMQLLTWEENNIKGRAGRKNKESCAEMSKIWAIPVAQYDTDGNLINKYESTHDVNRKTGYDSSLIARACRRNGKGIYTISKGYVWKYCGEPIRRKTGRKAVE